MPITSLDTQYDTHCVEQLSETSFSVAALNIIVTHFKLLLFILLNNSRNLFLEYLIDALQSTPPPPSKH